MQDSCTTAGQATARLRERLWRGRHKAAICGDRGRETLREDAPRNGEGLSAARGADLSFWTAESA